MAKKYGVKLLIDSARFAENAYFIKTREKVMRKKYKRYNQGNIQHADFMTMSSKKDAIVNMADS